MELAFRPVYELVELIKSKRLSPVELVTHILRRIEKLNPTLNAYLTVTEEKALQDARQAEQAFYGEQKLGALHGIPISIKDLHCTKGIRTTFGSLVYKDFVPDEDAIVVERLKAAGAIILGKTNTPELGQSGTTENKLGDHCRNPWDFTRTSGGSSGGAAASVAAGLCCLAQGSDGGGSIRIPASFCGVYGLKPSFGRVADKSDSNGMLMFAQNGPLTRCVRDAALMMKVISGPDPRDYTCIPRDAPDFVSEIDRPPGRMHIAWSPDLGYAPVDPEVYSIVKSAVRVFEDLGHSVEEATPAIGSPFEIFSTIALADTYAAYGFLLEKNADQLMDYVKSTLIAGSKITGAQYAHALRLLHRFRSAWRYFFTQYDLLMTPTVAVPAFPVGKRPDEIAGKKVSRLFGAFPFTVPWNLTGQPAASIPCGFSSGGLPVGLQIVGRQEDEITVLKASTIFEQARPWANKLPPEV
jgi:Asp-tRNA(Asn)/Glu-tRNA(Gln) amidotransferase A subunit family amidase